MQQPRGKAGFWHSNNSLLTDPIFAVDIRSFSQTWITKIANFDSPLIWWDKAKQHFKLIAIQRSIILWKICHESTQLEGNLQHLQQKAINRTPKDIENYLLTKRKVKQFELTELEAIQIHAKARFIEDRKKTTCYFYSLKK